MFFLLLLILGIICLSVAALVYNRSVRAKKNPWLWSIVAFVITGVIIVFGAYAIILYGFGFQR